MLQIFQNIALVGLFTTEIAITLYQILHDGSHIGSEVFTDLENIYPYLRHDGILVTHDTRHHDLGSDMMSAVNAFAQGRDIEMLTLPYGYGLTFFRNKANKNNPVTLTWEKQR